ncbi:DUF3224 domain-containing protein [Amycolatopsis sp. YIM 10]|uniref:DUF3224 domain-containing protein n=1 Tax=Amycolatopsis sp. YIM 10 TaxID=2653857 RepID=UPI00128FDAC9|nr:DUF3224 domain-containing protein [Amycolatopsis sp. YIM 10]QFU93561.1 hypothetical protein YIM_42125 [Amycolatopsis sp. YIM 10]
MNTFAMKSWDESVVSGAEDQPRYAHAHAVMTYSGLIEGESSVDYLLYYSGPGYDGAGNRAPGFERIEGAVDGRKGSFVIRHEVGFDSNGINGTFTVVDGSGTGELTGLRGTGTIAGATGESAMAYTFEYSI